MASECATCHKPHPWPDGTTPRHPFNDGSLSGSGVLRRPEQPSVMTPSAHPFDPVLRQALLDAGVITPGQLRDAQDKIDAVTGRFNYEAQTETRDG